MRWFKRLKVQKLERKVLKAQSYRIFELEDRCSLFERENREALETIENLGEYKARAELSFRAVVAQLGAIEQRLDVIEGKVGLKGDPQE